MRKLTMTPKERVLAALNYRDFDVFPVINPTSVAVVDGMRACGAFFPEAHTNPELMAELAAAGHELFGFDSVAPYFSIHLEAAALGAEVDWGDANNTPRVLRRPISDPGSFRLPSSFLQRDECQALLKCCRILKKRYGDKVPVIGKAVGPWTLAYNLYGVENLILDTILEPEKTKKLIVELARVSMDFAKAQFKAGADMVTWAEHTTSDLVSAQIYREFVMPVHVRAAAELQKMGPMILHICGNVMDRLADVAATGFRLFHMDSRNDIPKALEIVGRRVMLTGCINNPVTLSQGNRVQVRKEVEHNLHSGIRLISPECALPCNVPMENLKEMVAVAHQYGPLDVIRSR